MRRAGVEPDVEDVLHLLEVFGLVLVAEEALGWTLEPDVGALGLEGLYERGPSASGSRSGVAGLLVRRTRRSARPTRAAATRTQSGRCSIIAADADCGRQRGTKRVASIAASALLAQRAADLGNRLVHGRRTIAACCGRSPAPSSARNADRSASCGPRAQKRCPPDRASSITAWLAVAFLAVVIDDARGSTLHGPGEQPGASVVRIVGIVDSAGNGRIDAARAQIRRSRHPGIEVVAPWPGAVWTKPVPASAVTNDRRRAGARRTRSCPGPRERVRSEQPLEILRRDVAHHLGR